MKRIRFMLSTLITLGVMGLVASGGVLAEERGIQVVSIEDPDGNQVGLYRESHALVIGVSDYTNGWPDLPGVKQDVRLVREALQDQGFHVVVVENPDHEALQAAFNDFINRYGHDIDSRLLFYFAGHGHTLKLAYGGDMGYIVPADAPNPNRDRSGFLAKALDMERIEVFAKRIESRHALFLFDSCFSGSIFSLSRAVPENISYKTSQPVRQFITAGSANESVPDESIFRDQFLAALKGEGDTDGDGYLTGVELGEFLQARVVNYSQGSQHPQYGKIRYPLLDKGDFVFRVAPANTNPGLDSTDAGGQEELTAAIARLQAEKERLEKENAELQKNNGGSFHTDVAPQGSTGIKQGPRVLSNKTVLPENRYDREEPADSPFLKRAEEEMQKKNYPAALRILKVQAARGNAQAQVKLARMHAEGRGVPRDLLEAYKWMLLASRQNAVPKTALRRLEARLTPAQIRQARIWVKAREIHTLKRRR